MVIIDKEEIQHVVEYAEAITFYIPMFIFFTRLGTKVLACGEACSENCRNKYDGYDYFH